MGSFQQEFLSFAYESSALKFGEFTLNSGRVSPYFYNSASFSNGATLARLAEFYARSIAARTEGEYMLFGPAYKGIPLVVATAMALYRDHALSIPYAFNRKEAKDHGDEGWLVGAPIQGTVVIVEDVITSGISVGNAVRLIRSEGAYPIAAIISVDRLEVAVKSEFSAVQEVRSQCGIDVFSLATARDILKFVAGREELQEHEPKLRDYLDRYGA